MMPGNSQRKGAIKKTGKGNPTAGSGGRVRRGLEGKGPTPKATDRPYHKAHKKQRPRRRQHSARSRRPPAKAATTSGSPGATPWSRRCAPLAGDVGVRRRGCRARRPAARGVLDRRRQGLSLLEVPRVELDRMTAGAVHQGLAARVPAYEYAHPDDLLDAAAANNEPALIVALDSVTDPRNLGAVVRSAAGFGAHGVVVPERRAAGMTASAWKTSAGAAARVPVAQVVNLTRQLKAYQEAGCMVVGLAADGDVSLPDLDLADGPARARGRLGGQGPLAAGGRDLRPAGLDPDGRARWSRSTPGVAASVTLYSVAQKRALSTSGGPAARQIARAVVLRAAGSCSVWLLVAVPTWLVLFTHSSADTVVASHDAVVTRRSTARCGSTWVRTCPTSGSPSSRAASGCTSRSARPPPTSASELAAAVRLDRRHPEAEEDRIARGRPRLALATPRSARR